MVRLGLLFKSDTLYLGPSCLTIYSQSTEIDLSIETKWYCASLDQIRVGAVIQVWPRRSLLKFVSEIESA